MPDDPLFSGQGPLPDDLARLRAAAARLPLPPEPDWDAAPRGEASRPWFVLAAAVVIAASVVAVGSWLAADAWRVEALAGEPALRGFAFGGRLALGGGVATDEHSRARVFVPGLGEVDLEPASLLRRVSGRGTERRLALDHGVLHARISAPPRVFVVETHGAVATDLGCAYTLEATRDGHGRLSVTAGRVVFTDRGHESFVPAGVWCPLTPAGVGVPRRDYATDAFLAALTAYEQRASDPTALDSVLVRAEASDAITLWHLLPRVFGAARASVAARMAQLIELPAEVPTERILALDPVALDAWWAAIGMGPANEWRVGRSIAVPEPRIPR